IYWQALSHAWVRGPRDAGGRGGQGALHQASIRAHAAAVLAALPEAPQILLLFPGAEAEVRASPQGGRRGHAEQRERAQDLDEREAGLAGGGGAAGEHRGGGLRQPRLLWASRTLES